MPKVVDHDQRRVELIEATWRTIARTGWNSATMAAIAAEAGFANGALKPYFATKEDLFAAAFEHIYVQTGRRMATATAGKKGLSALRAFCHEILPLDDTTRDEARVIIPFWQEALTNPTLAARHEKAMRHWRMASSWRAARVGLVRASCQNGMMIRASSRVVSSSGRISRQKARNALMPFLPAVAVAMRRPVCT